MTDWLDARGATLPEITAFAARRPFAILPVGSFEQHGPHLPLDTDNIIAAAMAVEVARRSTGIVLPVLNMGYAWVWQGRPGTLSLRFDTYARVIRDLAESLDAWGIRALFVLSGHGANPQVVKQAIRAHVEGRMRIRVLNALYQGTAEMRAEAASRPWGDDFHAEEIETSLMLALAPGMVRMDLAAADYPPVPADYGKSELSMGHLMRTGVFGDPTAATAEKGHRWLALAGERTAALWLAYLTRHGLWP